MNDQIYNGLSTAHVFASELAKAGIVLDVASGGALQELVAMAVPVVDWSSQNYVENPKTGKQNHMKNNGLWHQMVENTVAGKPGTSTLYGNLLDSCINEYGKKLKAHIAYARNTVTPLVVSFAESFLKYGEQRLSVNPAREFTIEYVDMCPAYKDDAFNDLFNRYGSASDLPPVKKLELGTKTYEELLEMLSVGNARIDKLILEWASKLSEGFVVRVWNKYFTNMTDLSIFKDIASASLIDRSNTVIIVHLLARTILNKVEDTSLPLAKYEERVKQYLQWSGVGYLNCLGRMEQMIKSRTIVIESYSRSIVILATTYQEWLNQGGCPEIILGMLADGRITTTAASINEQAAMYKRAWENFETLQLSFEINQQAQRKREFLLDEFLRTYANYDEAEAKYLQDNPGYRESVIKSAKDYIKNINVKMLDSDHAHEVALELIAGFRFSFTASKQILEDIKNASKINPDADPRESALLAAVNYLSDFVYTMLSVRHVGI